jgi:uroporphyrin-III C-methyltransferase/precorrin-2 dehydrogenase/sirohydrochlorin ferrochelatase
MGVARLADVATAALARGVDGSMPVAIIERGSTPDERITRTTLAHAAEDAGAAGVTSPAIIVVGAVADPDLLQP